MFCYRALMHMHACCFSVQEFMGESAQMYSSDLTVGQAEPGSLLLALPPPFFAVGLLVGLGAEDGEAHTVSPFRRISIIDTEQRGQVNLQRITKNGMAKSNRMIIAIRP